MFQYSYNTHEPSPYTIGSMPVYRLTKVRMTNHSIFYNDTAQVVVIDHLLTDHVFYLECTPAEYHILRRLLQAPQTIIPFEQIMDHFEYERDVRTLRRHITRLKRKLPATLKIRNARRVGYTLEEVSPLATPPREEL